MPRMNPHQAVADLVEIGARGIVLEDAKIESQGNLQTAVGDALTARRHPTSECRHG